MLFGDRSKKKAKDLCDFWKVFYLTNCFVRCMFYGKLFYNVVVDRKMIAYKSLFSVWFVFAYYLSLTVLR